MGWCRSLRDVDLSCTLLRGKLREVEDPLFFELPPRGLPGVEKGALMFGLLDSPLWMVERNCVTHSKRLLDISQTLPSSALRDTSLE